MEEARQKESTLHDPIYTKPYKRPMNSKDGEQMSVAWGLGHQGCWRGGLQRDTRTLLGLVAMFMTVVVVALQGYTCVKLCILFSIIFM